MTGYDHRDPESIRSAYDQQETYQPSLEGMQYRPGYRDQGPSRAFYALAAIILVTGVAFFIYFLVMGIMGLEDQLTQVVVPGKADLSLAQPGHYTVFHEYQSVVADRVYAGGQNISGLQLRLRSRDTGQEVTLRPASANSTYSLGSRAGYSIFEFDLDQPGEYEFSASYPEGTIGPEAVLAIGREFVGNLLITIFGGTGIMLGSMALAAIIIVITATKRQKARQQRPDSLTAG